MSTLSANAATQVEPVTSHEGLQPFTAIVAFFTRLRSAIFLSQELEACLDYSDEQLRAHGLSRDTFAQQLLDRHQL